MMLWQLVELKGCLDKSISKHGNKLKHISLKTADSMWSVLSTQHHFYFVCAADVTVYHAAS